VNAKKEEMDGCDEIRLPGWGQFMKIFICYETEILHADSLTFTVLFHTFNEGVIQYKKV